MIRKKVDKVVIKCFKEKHDYLLFIDLEFDNTKLIQFAALLFKSIDEDGGYQLMRSYNAYVSATVCYPFAEYTKITNNFLAENGVPLKDVKSFIFDELLKEVPLNKVELISHGLRNDRVILIENGINLSNIDGKAPIDGYCTFKNARRILKRTTELSLNDLALELGFYMFAPHNAYNDVWATVAVFTYLKKLEEIENDNKNT